MVASEDMEHLLSFSDLTDILKLSALESFQNCSELFLNPKTKFIEFLMLLFIFWGFQTIFFHCIISLHPTPPSSYSATVSTKLPFFVVFFPFFFKKINQNREKDKWNLIFVGNYSWTRGMAWNVVDISNVTPLEKCWFSLAQQLSIENSLVRSGTSCHLPLLRAGVYLVWACVNLGSVCCHGVHDTYQSRWLKCRDKPNYQYPLPFNPSPGSLTLWS